MDGEDCKDDAVFKGAILDIGNARWKYHLKNILAILKCVSANDSSITVNCATIDIFTFSTCEEQIRIFFISQIICGIASIICKIGTF